MLSGFEIFRFFVSDFLLLLIFYVHHNFCSVTAAIQGNESEFESNYILLCNSFVLSSKSK